MNVTKDLLSFYTYRGANEGLNLVSSVGQFEAKVSESPRLVFFSMDGCGWCDRAKPEWKKFCNNEVGTKGIMLRVNESTRPIFEKAKVSGYPTFMIARKIGKEIKYEDANLEERTADVFKQVAHKI